MNVFIHQKLLDMVENSSCFLTIMPSGFHTLHVLIVVKAIVLQG